MRKGGEYDNYTVTKRFISTIFNWLASKLWLLFKILNHVGLWEILFITIGGRELIYRPLSDPLRSLKCNTKWYIFMKGLRAQEFYVKIENSSIHVCVCFPIGKIAGLRGAVTSRTWTWTVTTRGEPWLPAGLPVRILQVPSAAGMHAYTWICFINENNGV